MLCELDRMTGTQAQALIHVNHKLCNTVVSVQTAVIGRFHRLCTPCTLELLQVSSTAFAAKRAVLVTFQELLLNVTHALQVLSTDSPVACGPIGAACTILFGCA